jgi:hypothetical protein
MDNVCRDQRNHRSALRITVYQWFRHGQLSD